ncbi:protein kinase domain-containing protein [Georgenia alba]|uniref:Protein kinase n=1 Tax=Georgenia alba TaxID=2233858 RepID=A0ABW2Q4R7_9MICO
MTEPVDPTPDGQREVGGYRLLRRLGAGGMGTVHEAVDADGRHVALKLLHPHIATDPQARRRLAREVALLHRVKDAGVARVLDAEVEDAEAFVVTELVDGPTLEDDVTDGGAFTLDELAGLAHGLAASLRAIHAQGIVHRDLKPGNVMLSDDGPVLIDFGIAQVADDVRLTQTGLVTGTPGYLDPEVIAGGDPGTAGDWWAWAAVLLFSATARPPFGRGAIEAVLARVATGRADTTGLPATVGRALRGALDPDPDRRLPPEQVLEVLDVAADDPEAAGDPEGTDTQDGVDRAAATTPLGMGAAPTAPVIPPTMPVARPGTAASSGAEPPTGRTPEDLDPAPLTDVQPVHGAGPATKVLPAMGGHPGPVPDETAGPSPSPYPLGPPETMPPPGAYATPRWAVPARRRSATVLAVGVGVSAAAASFPGIFIVVAVALLVLTATTGWAGRSRRSSRLRRGLRRGDDARMVAGLPWHLLRGVGVLLPGVAVGAVLGGVLWWFGGQVALPVAANIQEPVALWAAGFLALFAAWLTPTSSAARDGARAWLDVLTPGPGYRALLVTVFLGYAAVVAVQVALGEAPAATWVPLPITLVR